MSSTTTLPLFRLLLIYISGILLAICYETDLVITLIFLLTLSLLYLGSSIKFSATNATWRNGIGLFLIFLMGYSNLLLQTTQAIRLINWFPPNELEGYTVSIQKIYDPLSCKALITHIKNDTKWYKNNRSIQLYFSKKCGYQPKEGDSLLIRGRPIPISSLGTTKPVNRLRWLTHASKYRHTLKHIDQDFMLLAPKSFDKSKKWGLMITEWFTQTLQKQIKDKQAMGFIATLLWGAKDSLNPDLQKSYAKAGTIHVLAISGLHVGMFYLLIKAVFTFICRNTSCAICAELCTLLVVWLYVALCHFAPPILRATIMITMGRLGWLIGRGSNRYNGCIASAFGLLLWNPFLLFNCGCQLSYLATLGILYLQPYIHRLIILKNYWLDKIWSATSLSIAAQISTLPLILYYFKAFPLYFIIANWLVVPAIFAILMLTLALLLCSHLPIVNRLLSVALEKLIFNTNEWVCWIAQWPMSTLAVCCINGYYVCLLYIVLLSICLFLEHKNLIYPIIITFCTFLCILDQIKIIIAKQKQCKMVCYNNDELSFTLKDGIKQLGCDTPCSNKSLLRRYPGGIIAKLV